MAWGTGDLAHLHTMETVPPTAPPGHPPWRRHCRPPRARAPPLALLLPPRPPYRRRWPRFCWPRRRIMAAKILFGRDHRPSTESLATNSGGQEEKVAGKILASADDILASACRSSSHSAIRTLSPTPFWCRDGDHRGGVRLYCSEAVPHPDGIIGNHH